MKLKIAYYVKLDGIKFNRWLAQDGEILVSGSTYDEAEQNYWDTYRKTLLEHKYKK